MSVLPKAERSQALGCRDKEEVGCVDGWLQLTQALLPLSDLPPAILLAFCELIKPDTALTVFSTLSSLGPLGKQISGPRSAEVLHRDQKSNF